MTRRFMLSLSVLISLVLMLAGCASSSPAPATPETTATTTAAPAAASSSLPQPSPDMATVYIYRPKAFVGFALHPTVMLDGQDLINVANGTVWAGNFKPGHYVFQMDDKKSGAELDLQAGELYYFRVEIVPGMWKGGGRMTLMAKEQGSLEIKNLAPLAPTEVEHPMFK
ncbi:MAG: DUF2846 domain-containing protein [Thermoanaerobaculia bacterium]